MTLSHLFPLLFVFRRSLHGRVVTGPVSRSDASATVSCYRALPPYAAERSFLSCSAVADFLVRRVVLLVRARTCIPCKSKTTKKKKKRETSNLRCSVRSRDFYAGCSFARKNRDVPSWFPFGFDLPVLSFVAGEFCEGPASLPGTLLFFFSLAVRRDHDRMKSCARLFEKSLTRKRKALGTEGSDCQRAAVLT